MNNKRKMKKKRIRRKKGENVDVGFTSRMMIIRLSYISFSL
jgi:hypothetical protein